MIIKSQEFISKPLRLVRIGSIEYLLRDFQDPEKSKLVPKCYHSNKRRIIEKPIVRRTK